MKIWAVLLPESRSIYLDSISYSKRGAIATFCDNGDYAPKDDWSDWVKRGAKVVKCTLTIDNNPGKEGRR